MGDPGKPNPHIDDVISQGHAFLRVPMSRVRYPYANDYLSVGSQSIVLMFLQQSCVTSHCKEAESSAMRVSHPHMFRGFQTRASRKKDRSYMCFGLMRTPAEG